MTQETSLEFGDRLRQAIEGHPLAPPTHFGRQKWLKDKLERETQLTVSPNAAHKWMHGASRPREDTIRKIAKVLQVDEVWLAHGRRPLLDQATAKVESIRGHGATLVVAGLIEMGGGRVTFPNEAESATSIWADLGAGRHGMTVVAGQRRGTAISYVVPEPVGSNWIIAVNVQSPDSDCASGRFELHDLTKTTRKNFGGFSVIQAEVLPEGKLKIEGRKNLLEPIPNFAALS